MRNEVFAPLRQALNEVEFPSNEVTAGVYKLLEALDNQLADAGFDPNTDLADASSSLEDVMTEYYEDLGDEDEETFEEDE